ncbi:MAG: SUMF1/EgtB/PvdO family nonheme iron enzyme [Chloroflexi bacterium]|uniref:Bifunctional serine/threonine-protein kinase/formylglycine-generating enzyme family protein n=1 Tax=Candidatus Chlorohelix allophototropha TaxID=3003348 RepID=A0A8T7M0M1_9CHLR|nr:SUMF1/EgtB/PvdO family nonheme iron enzyme [Chloroflexota bacterium]WJW67282.1 bifunctional serine/threonine-protein kinase/formylglycine-generating enzyme family protein [Chloroflexota bacterium L227-S17]
MNDTILVVKELQAGYQVDRYLLEEPLGRGGCGEVWLACHQNKNLHTKKYAIKFLTNPGPREQNRFEREMQILAQLDDNPHIIKALDCGEIIGTLQALDLVNRKVTGEQKGQTIPFLVMEYATKGDISKQIGKVSPQEIAEHLEQIADGLDYAHKLGIIHRDLKPGNLLLDSRNEIKIADFGIAHTEDSHLTSAGSSFGTPAYMAPEQFSDAGNVGNAADVYSLGVVIFQLLTGSLPFESTDFAQLIIAHYQKPLPKLRNYGANLPEQLQEVLERATAKEPSSRYLSVGAFATAFKQALVPKVAAPKIDGYSANIKPMQKAQFAPAPVINPNLVTPTEAPRLLREIADPRTTHKRRMEIGDRLNEIGDPRSGVGLRSDDIPDIAWLLVAPGGYLQIKGTPFDVQPFYIAQYQITYAQYEAFVKATDGYNNPLWWKGFPRECRRQKLDKQSYGLLSNPRDSLSWYQSVALGRWLNNCLRGMQFPNPSGGDYPLIVGDNAQVRLPTEWEWQWAAQGGSEQRKFPWGKWQEGYANTDEIKLGRAIAVGMYPQGAAKCGAMDISGNLWEWCLNKYKKPGEADADESEAAKVLRGGSFSLNQAYASCIYRYHDEPKGSLYDVGFRLVLSTPIAGL